MTPTDKNKSKSKTSASKKIADKKAISRPIGQVLKKARLEKGIRLTQIVQQLNISQSYIQAIEEGKINELPKEQTYTIGFVKSYAQAVDLDCQETVEKFKQEFYAESEQYDLSEDEAEIEEQESIIHNPSPNSKILWGSLGVAALAIGIWYFASKSSLSDSDKEAESVMEEATEDTEKLVEAAKQLPIDYPVAQQVATGLVKEDVSYTNNKAAAEKAGKKSDSEMEDATFVYEDNQENEVIATPEDSDSVMVISEEPADNKSDSDMDSESKGFVSDPSKLPILITVTEDTWIEIKDPENEDLYLSKVIAPGYIYQVPKKGLVLSTGNAGATLITVGSNSLPSIGKDGQVLKDVYLGVVELKEKYIKND